MGMEDLDERNEVMDELTLVARGLSANDNGATLNRIRYETKNNEHNAMIIQKAPEAWAEWQKET